MRGLASWTVAAATVVCAAALWGGAFLPLPAAVVGVGLALVLAWRVPGLPGFAVSRDELLAAAFLTWGVVAALASGAAPLAAKQITGTWLAAVLLWAGARRSEPASRAAAARLVALVTALLSVGVLVQWAVIAEARAGGVLENPNVAAALVVTGTLAAMPHLDRRLRAALAALAALALVGTGSRAGFVAAGVALVVLLPAGRVRRAGAAAAAAVMALAVWWRLASVPDPFAWHRPALWRAVLELVSRHLLAGVGPGGLADAAGVVRLAENNPVAIHQWHISYAESTPLAVLVAVGLPGLLLAAAAIVTWLIRLRRDGASRWTWAVAAAVMVFALVHDQLDVAVILWWWALILGLADAPPAPRPVASPHRWWLVGAVVVTALIWSLAQPAAVRVWWSAAPHDQAATRAVLRVEPFFASAPEALVRRALGGPPWDWPRAVETAYWSQRAVAAHPGDAALWADEARVYSRMVRDLGTWPGAVERARRAWREATSREPNLPWYWYGWAFLERSLGDPARARSLVQRALAAEPHFVRGWLLLARLELDLGRIPAARAAVARALDSRRLTRGRLLTGYERDLLMAPQWQLRELEGALP